MRIIIKDFGQRYLKFYYVDRSWKYPADIQLEWPVNRSISIIIEGLDLPASSTSLAPPPGGNHGRWADEEQVV